MARLASAADFEGGAMYMQYQRYPFFVWRAAWLTQRYGTAGKWLVAGCGWGFLVDELVALGVDAWGLDGSAYAVGKAATEVPAVAARVQIADATSRSQMAAVRTAAGLTGQQRFAVVVTEDVLPVLTDAEVSTAVTEARRVATNVLHICTCLRPGEVVDPAVRMAGLNWKSLAAWKAAVTPDSVLDAEGFLRYPDGSFSSQVA